MRLRDLRDVYRNQDIYIVGSGPTSSLFPMELLADKICLGLNDAYKIHPNVTPIALMHHATYAHAGNTSAAPYHPNFLNIRYPIVKGTGRTKSERINWDHPHFYYYDWSHDIEDIRNLTKETDVLCYTPEGSSLHAALQVCWIMGAKNIFIIGCDSRTFGGKHYASYDKNGFRADEVLKRGVQRNYNSYVYGSLILREFLQSKGISVVSLSPMFGYTALDFQFDVLKGVVPISEVYESVRRETAPPDPDEADDEAERQEGISAT